MDMIIVHTHPLNYDLISLLYPYRGFLYYIHHITIKQHFPIFHRKYYVIVYLPRTMISLVYLKSLFHAPSLTHKVTP